jgi:hypothetical protein
MNRFAIAPVDAAGAVWDKSQPVDRNMLTPVQIRIILFIRDYQDLWGESPLYREIGRACGLRSDSAVGYQIGRLVVLGVLRKPARLVRAMHLMVVPVKVA